MPEPTKPRMKITYSTMSADNEELQSAFDATFAKVREKLLSVEVPMFIDGERVYANEKTVAHSPADTRIALCTAQKGTTEHARAAVAAARAAFPAWAATPWQERVAAIRRAADLISENNFELSAIMCLEVGKSRLEALGEVEETADLIRYYADAMEKNHGYVNELGKLSDSERNQSVLKPFGVWVVISPFNFPMALSGAPIAAALVTGNTVVFKGASTTLYTGWRTAELFAEAGIPAGVFNYVSGPGRTVGQELLDNPGIDGWTFTGSYDVGMQVARNAVSGVYPRPAIIEMGGKNPVIVSERADLEKAATGVARSAFGLDGQKCSACSRAYVQASVYDAFLKKLIEKTAALKVGDPTSRAAFMGSVIDRSAYEDYQRYVERARADGAVLFGGSTITDGEFAHG
jgi:1-pyrroline-5-carboxylate dehydrogenase